LSAGSAHKEENATKAIEALKDNATQSLLAGFETALEQATVVLPTLDLSTLDLGKIVVSNQLREE